LLRYYDSKSTAHVGYLISLAIVSYWLVQLFVGPDAPLYNGVKPVLGEDIALVFRCACFSVFFALCVHLLGRTLFWGNLANFILDAKLEPLSENTAHYRLHLTTRELFLRHIKSKKGRWNLPMRFARQFQGLHLKLLLGSILIIFFVLTFYDYWLKYLLDLMKITPFVNSQIAPLIRGISVVFLLCGACLWWLFRSKEGPKRPADCVQQVKLWSENKKGTVPTTSAKHGAIEDATRETSTLTLVSIAIASSLILLTVQPGVLDLTLARLLGLAVAFLGIAYRELTVHMYFPPSIGMEGLKRVARILRSLAVRIYQVIPIIAWSLTPNFKEGSAFFAFAMIIVVAGTCVEEIRYRFQTIACDSGTNK